MAQQQSAVQRPLGAITSKKCVSVHAYGVVEHQWSAHFCNAAIRDAGLTLDRAGNCVRAVAKVDAIFGRPRGLADL